MKKCYFVFNNFVFRTPLFAVDKLNEVGIVSTSDIFKEAIYLASPDLFGGDNHLSDSGKEEKYNRSILKYFIRSAMRCTPFGLFAGCSVGVFGDENDIVLDDTENYRRVTRLDMQYLCALIQKLESEPDIRNKLKYYPNDTAYQVGDKLRYIEYRYKGTHRKHQVSSVDSSEYLIKILDGASHGATIEELSNSIVDYEISYNEANEFVNEIINEHILKSELEPAVVGDDVFESLIKKLRNLNIESWLIPLKEIHSLLTKIDSSVLGSSMPLYKEIIEKIDALGIKYEPKFLFQSDMFKPVKKATISRKIADDLNDAVGFLSLINEPVTHQNLKSFTEAFSARYEEREVSLSMVLDNEIGIGYPVGTKGGDLNPLIEDIIIPNMTPTGGRTIPYNGIDRYLFKKYIECIKNGKALVSTKKFQKFFEIVEIQFVMSILRANGLEFTFAV